ncbi:MFS transporter [Luteolibacter pohnpeiensis]|uniref:MFS transporter n=1 Tax=Luteolibacter pohnpeiensis TaxID=454153 RepID=A0A934SAS6_9BACT|nr:MFS transporter [Luteolibacter pohnpeiensis]MBK1881913.1 MFS transporter [Luteolibacter pohnpeiensis]
MTASSPPNARLRLSVMMFLQFFVWGCFFVPLSGYLGEIFADRVGLNTIIGNSYATQTWGGLIAPLFVGLIADRFMNAERVNGILHIIGAGILFYCSTITEPGKLFWGLLAYFLCYMPTLALVNTITFNNIENSDQDFPKIRLWGTVGWIIAGIVIAESIFGLVGFPVLPGISDAGNTSFPMKLSAVVSLIYGVYSFTLPATPPSAKGTPISITKMLGFDAFSLFKDPGFAVFGICSFLICIPLAFYYAMTYSFMGKIAFGDKTASVMALGQVSEVVFMALVPLFFRKLGVKWMLLVGMLSWTLRYAIFGLAFSTPALLVLGIMLHGICYDFFFVTGQLYTDRKAPREIRASAQGLIALITYGAGMLVGNKVLGWWGDRIGLDSSTAEGWNNSAKLFWLMPAGIAFAVAILFAIAFWDKSADKGEMKH